MLSKRLVALLLGGILGGSPAWAQTVTLVPSFTVTEEYDDNVRLTPTNEQSDFITGLRPGLSFEIRDAWWEVKVGGSALAQYYAERSELDNTTDQQQGSLKIELRPTARLSFSLADTLTRGLNPGQADPETGLVTGRFRSLGNTVSPGGSYQVTPLTTLRLRYALKTLRFDSPLGQDSDTHEAEGTAERQLTTQDTGFLRYTWSRFLVEDRPDLDAHSPRVGLAHMFSPAIRLSANAGPLFIEQPDGTTETTWGAGLLYQQDWKRAGFSLAYDRNARLAGAIGEVGTSQSLKAALNVAVTRDLKLELESGVTDTQGPARLEFLTYTAGMRINYEILRWLSLHGEYRYQNQNDRTGPRDMERNLVLFGLTVSTQTRLY